MTTATITAKAENEPIHSTHVRFNWGYWDARNDMETGGKDRRTIKEGELFALPCSPSSGDLAYRKGYGAGWDEKFKDDSTSEEAWKSEP